jgi:hypothetical protein
MVFVLLMMPTPWAKKIKLAEQRGPNAQAYAFPHPGSLSVVAIPFGEGHRGRPSVSHYPIGLNHKS